MKIVIFSDTHGLHDKVNIPGGDMLIFAGDMCGHSKLSDVFKFNKFIASLPHEFKVVIAGNHDWPFQRDYATARIALSEAIYLQDEEVIINGKKLYGSPWQPNFNNWAFNLPRHGHKIKQYVDAIPSDTDILITHGPPAFMLDCAGKDIWLGCDYLRKSVYNRIKPELHAFGHIHESYGQVIDEGIIFANASVCDGDYSPINKPIVVEI